MPDIVKRIIDEIEVEGRRLGRHVHHDERSKRFIAPQAAEIVSVRHQPGGAGWLPLDQGTLGSCTANALVGARMLAPDVGGRGRFFEKDAVWLYWQEVVTIEGGRKGQDLGGTGIDVCKAAINARWISSYAHTFSFESALRALVLRPVLLGCNWYQGFDNPDQNGIVQIAGQIRGGHEIVADEIDTARQLVGFTNSWGLGYGLQGRFYMPYAVLEQLLSEVGDVTVPIVSFQ